jgi:class 3 adenylate cyclase
MLALLMTIDMKFSKFRKIVTKTKQARRIFLAIAACLIFLLLLAKSQVINFKLHSDYLVILRQINEKDANLERNVLLARYGTLKYYDPINQDLEIIKNNAKLLSDCPNFINPVERRKLKQLLNAYQQTIEKKENEVELFKTNNATLKTSLAYFPTAANTLVKASSQNTELVLRTNQLLQNILIYNISPSSDLLEQLKFQIQTLRKNRNRLTETESRALFDNMLAHAQIILQNLPQVNRSIAVITTLSTMAKIDEIGQAYMTAYQHALKATSLYRFLLYLFSLGLTIAIATSIVYKLKRSANAIQHAKDLSDRLLLNILPKEIAEQLKQVTDSLEQDTTAAAIAEQFDCATILFADIVGFTPLSAKLPARELVNLLNQIFSEFDRLAQQYNLEKIKTIGDAYMVAGGLPMRSNNHAESIAEMALGMQVAIDHFQGKICQSLQIRIGINTGTVVAGVIGRRKFIYDLWGDAVNVASRMESSGIPGKIQLTAETYALLKDKYEIEERGIITVKGKGDMMTYWLVGRIN